MVNCNICLEDFTGNYFQCPQSKCKAIACEECMWKHCNSIALIPECCGVKCHYQITNEELYTLNPDKYKQWKTLIEERILSKALRDVKFAYAKQLEYNALLEQNMDLSEIRYSSSASDEEKANANKMFEKNRKRIAELEEHKPVTPENPWLIACPTNGCIGLLDTTHKCSSCKNTYCKECNCLLGSNHVCKEEDVSSVNEIKSKCKPCPKCHSMIYREEGCSQMWCTNCKHGFDWGNGRILDVTRNFHNPHYADYARRTQTTEDTPNIDPNQCQVLIPLKEVEKNVNGDMLNHHYEWLTELATEQQNIGDKIISIDNIRENCLRNLGVRPPNPEMDVTTTKPCLFRIHQAKGYLYDHEQLIATILSIGIGLINTASTQNIDVTLNGLKNLKECYDDRMARMDILYK